MDQYIFITRGIQTKRSHMKCGSLICSFRQDNSPKISVFNEHIFFAAYIFRRMWALFHLGERVLPHIISWLIEFRGNAVTCSRTCLTTMSK